MTGHSTPGLRVAVTGGRGAIGRRLADYLTRMGADLRLLDTQAATSDVAATRQIVGSILDPDAVARTVAGCDAVVHLAAETIAARCQLDPVACFRLNVLGTVAVLEASRRAGVRHFVFVSTAYVYGQPSRLPVDETMPVQPASAYAASKAAAESAVWGWSRTGPAGSILRLSNVYGPRVSGASLVGQLVGELRQSGRLQFRCGSPMRDFVYVDDVAEAVARIVTAGPPAGGMEILNVGSGTGHAVRDLVAQLQDAAETQGLARPPAMELEPHAADEVPALVLDVSALALRLGWRPATDLREGLRRTLDAQRNRAT